jgi:hypothetical protein
LERGGGGWRALLAAAMCWRRELSARPHAGPDRTLGGMPAAPLSQRAASAAPAWLACPRRKSDQLACLGMAQQLGWHRFGAGAGALERGGGWVPSRTTGARCWRQRCIDGANAWRNCMLDPPKPGAVCPLYSGPGVSLRLRRCGTVHGAAQTGRPVCLGSAATSAAVRKWRRRDKTPPWVQLRLRRYRGPGLPRRLWRRLARPCCCLHRGVRGCRGQ